jgi:hypothetical protein
MKTAKLIAVILSSATLTLTTSCKKDSSNEMGAYTLDAMIIDEGPLSGDGCDWVVVADSTYHPLNLSDQYKVNNSRVTVTFHKANSKFYCGLLPLHLSEIMIDHLTVKQ